MLGARGQLAPSHVEEALPLVLEARPLRKMEGHRVQGQRLRAKDATPNLAPSIVPGIYGPHGVYVMSRVVVATRLDRERRTLRRMVAYPAEG